MTRAFLFLSMFYFVVSLTATLTACGTDDDFPLTDTTATSGGAIADSTVTDTTTVSDSTTTDSTATDTTTTSGGTATDSTATDSTTTDNTENSTTPDMTTRITLTIGSARFAATLDTTDAAQAFADLLPMTVRMAELNGNEKYCSLSQSLPTATYRPGTIHAGDLLLWGSSTVVLFYETFSSSYSYTRLGSLDDPDGLVAAVGSGAVTVTFEAAE